MARSVYYKHVVGADALSFALRTISDEMRSTVLESALRATCQPVLVAAKRFAKRSERTGALRESLTIKTVAYPAAGKAIGLVGPDRGYYSGRLKITRLNASLRNAEKPASYAHLVEFGHHVVTGGSLRRQYNHVLVETGGVTKTGKAIMRWKRGTVRSQGKGAIKSWVPAKPFIRPALLTTTAQQSAAFTKAIEDGLNRSIAKANAGAARLK